MRAGAATCRTARTRHLAAAGLTANRIRNLQMSSGAAAAPGWLRTMEFSDTHPFTAQERPA
jgi:hypothetical protein